jgi:hypothetical protein
MYSTVCVVWYCYQGTTGTAGALMGLSTTIAMDTERAQVQSAGSDKRGSFRSSRHMLVLRIGVCIMMQSGRVW